MRLFGKVDGQINRFDRAMYLTSPFDLAWSTPAVPLVGGTWKEPARVLVWQEPARPLEWKEPART